MLQSESEFIRVLKDRLEGTLQNEEIEDIVSDYAEHFRMGKADGRSEEDLYLALGSPEDVAREIRASHLVRKAECHRSCGNLFHAIVATLGLGLFNLVFVLMPFLILICMLLVVFIIGVMFTILGPVTFVFALFQLLSIGAFAIWLSPLAGFFFAISMTGFGILLIIGDYYLARIFYHLGIRYLKWNISVITGTGCTA